MTNSNYKIIGRQRFSVAMGRQAGEYPRITLINGRQRTEAPANYTDRIMSHDLAQMCGYSPYDLLTGAVETERRRNADGTYTLLLKVRK